MVDKSSDDEPMDLKNWDETGRVDHTPVGVYLPVNPSDSMAIARSCAQQVCLGILGFKSQQSSLREQIFRLRMANMKDHETII